jgi:hypothetical protein
VRFNTASLNSLAANVPVNLLLALVKNKKWTPEQGLAYALQNPEPEEKVNSLTELVNYLPPSLQELALQKALTAARAIQHEYYRANALSALAEKLPPELLPEALAAARAIQDERYRADALRALADKLPDILPEALLLVVVLVPDSQQDWLQQSETELCLKRCAYWVSIRNQPPTENQTTVTVYLPRQNIFSVEALIALMQQITSGEPI